MDIKLLNRDNEILDIFSNKFFSKLNFTQFINKPGTGSFEMTIENSNDKFEFLKMNNRIVIEDENGIYFSGFIYSIEPTYKSINTFKIKEMLGIFENKIFYSDVTYTNETVNDILQDIIDTINARENMNITLDCGITDIIPDKEYKAKTTIITALKDLLDTKYEYIVKSVQVEGQISFVLTVKDTIGIDRTGIGNDFVSYTYDLEDAQGRTIDTVSGNLDIRNTGNAIIGSSGASFSEQSDPTSISDNGRIEKSFSTNGDLVSETASYLEERKDPTTDISVTPRESDFFQVGLGDLVKIITSGNKFLEFNESIKVVGKNYTFGDLTKIGIILNKKNIKSIDFIDQINNLTETVNNL